MSVLPPVALRYVGYLGCLLSAVALLSGAPAQAAKAPKAIKSKASSAKSAPAGEVLADIVLAHQLDPLRAARLQTLVDRYNASNPAPHIRLALHHDDEAPALLNLLDSAEAGSVAQHHRVNFKSIQSVLGDARRNVDSEALTPEVRRPDLLGKGGLQALPLAFSSPVLFYNKAAFREAGLNPEAPPRTWAEMQEAAGKLARSGAACPYTTSWPTWIHLDNMSARSGAGVARGRELNFNGLVQVKHVAMLASWQRSRYFISYGRRDEGDAHFANGDCAMLTSNADLYAALQQQPGLEVGVAPLPYHDDVYGEPQAPLSDGEALWLGAGRKPEEYRAAGRFVNFLLTPEAQVDVVRTTGFLPLTNFARSQLKRLDARDLQAVNVVYAQLPQLRGKSPAGGPRLAANKEVQRIVDEELEAVWAGRKPAKQALDDAVLRANRALQAQPKTHLLAAGE